VTSDQGIGIRASLEEQHIKDFVWSPMPVAPDSLTDLSLRTRVRRETTPRFPFPIPNGWFIVARADELPEKGVMPLYYFGKDLALFRGAGGKPYLFDAYCPHLGAHLGVGSQVDGDSLRCVFHGWKFDGETGACTDVPYDDVDFIPKKARARAYPTIERNHMIWAWHHLEGLEPFYDVPVVPEYDDPDWLAMDVREFAVKSCCQEMAENNYDTVHFKFVHGQETIPQQDDLIDGYYKRSATLDGGFVREGFGLGLGVLRLAGLTFLSSTTPIDEENLLVRWLFTAPRALGEKHLQDMADLFCSGVSQDLPIWENKIYKDPPVLRPMERGVTEHRRWCRQFYSYVDETHPGLQGAS
jgi:nitrite reductase/ring-hydroxylating ferredoxin subunit